MEMNTGSSLEIYGKRIRPNGDAYTLSLILHLENTYTSFRFKCHYLNEAFTDLPIHTV